MSNNKTSNEDVPNQMLWLIGGVVFILVIAVSSCVNDSSTAVNNSSPVSDYQDMRNRGHNEEDAVIFSILKQQGYSDYDAVQAMQSSKEQGR